MATQKYRGEHSPEAGIDEDVIEAPQPGKMPRIKSDALGNAGANFLFFVPLPLLLDGFSKISDARPFAMLVSFGCFALLVFSAWLLREGLKAEQAYNQRTIARPPTMPRKMMAAALSGVGAMLAAWFGWDKGMITGVIFGMMATGAHLAAFGFDPLSKKGLEGQSEFDVDRVARAVEKSEAVIVEIKSAAGRIGNKSIENRVNRLVLAVQEMLRVVENDPRDLAKARKYMTVYLKGARDATQKFADVYPRSKDAAMRDEFLALIDDLETSFDGQREALLKDNQTDLDIEIQVLQERLQTDGHVVK